jgi:hypothetical protein
MAYSDSFVTDNALHAQLCNTAARRYVVFCNKELCSSEEIYFTLYLVFIFRLKFKGIVSPDWKGLHMFSLDRFEV